MQPVIRFDLAISPLLRPSTFKKPTAKQHVSTFFVFVVVEKDMAQKQTNTKKALSWYNQVTDYTI